MLDVVSVGEGEGTGQLWSKLIENQWIVGIVSLRVGGVRRRPVGAAPWVADSHPLLILTINVEVVGTNDLVSVATDPGFVVSSKEDSVLLVGPSDELFPESKTLLVVGGPSFSAIPELINGIVT